MDARDGSALDDEKIPLKTWFRQSSDEAEGAQRRRPNGVEPDVTPPPIVPTRAAPASNVRAEPSPRLTAQLIAQIPRLRRYATAWLGHAVDADDLVRDCIQDASARGGPDGEPGDLGIWLLGILNGAHNRDRPEGSGQPLNLSQLEQTLLRNVPAAEADDLRDFAGAMAELSGDHRQVLLLIALEGLSYREVADVLGIPVGTVMSRLARARERLRGLLEETDEIGVRRVK